MTREEILTELKQQQQLLQNYEELLTDQDDDAAYIVRGNGFCDSKYSEDFIIGQTEKIRSRISDLEKMIQ